MHKKVLIFITKSNWGGAQRYVYDIATRIPKEAYSVEVMAGGNGPFIERLNQAGIPANGDLPIGRDVNLKEDFKSFFKTISILKEKRPDILHVNSSKMGGLGALAGRLVGIKKIIFTAHGFAFNEDRSVFSKLIIKILNWITIVLSHETIAVSEDVKNQIKNWPFIEEKIKVIRNGVPTEALFSKANARYELLKMNEGLKKVVDSIKEKDLIWVGTIAELHPIKGYEYAIKAINELKNIFTAKNLAKKVIYTIMGSGEEWEKLQKMIDDLGLKDNVFLMGNIENASHYVKAFDIFLLSSISEALGYVLLEAGAGTVPVVATAVGGIPEIIEDMKSGILIQPRKSSEIASSLEFLISHKKVQKEYSVALHEKVLKDFSIDRMVRETQIIYSRVIDGQQTRFQ